MAGAGSRFIIPNQFSVGATGPRAGAQLFFYATNTNTPQNTYSDSTLSTPNPNPVVADSLGQFGNVFLLLSPAYRVTLKDADDVEIWTMDPVGPQITSGGAVPVGTILAYGGPTAPSGYQFCSGAAISRTTYAELFAVIGTTWGPGDSSTTFNLPDLRGRAPFGKDNMGGGAASRLTVGVSGVAGSTLGASGGDQRQQLHNHAVGDPTHTHTATDPGHVHAGDGGQFMVAGAGGTLNPNLGTLMSGKSNTASAATGVTVAAATTGIQIANTGAGASQNVPPAAVVNYIICAST